MNFFFAMMNLLITLFCGILVQCEERPIIEDISRNPTRADRYGYQNNEITPKPHHIEEREDGSKLYKLFIITDMDRDSKGEDYKWRAVTRNGTLLLNPDRTSVKITWDPSSDVNIMSGFSYNGRGMELSDLVEYDGRILAPDDKTGIIFEIKDNKALPWVILNNGPGNTTEGLKVEWTTVKEGLLYAGSHGDLLRNSSGDVVSKNRLWVKEITVKGEVRSIDWTDVYARIQEFAGFPLPGYIKHEAVQFSSFHDKWFFLPRKASKIFEEIDERSGANILIIADRDVQPLSLVSIGRLDHPERTFSAFAFIPGTDDSLIVALKTKELEGEEMESFVTVFDVAGNILLDDQKLEGNYKFEGIYFT